MLHNRDEAYALLRSLGASNRLIRHLQLVGEAADELLNAYDNLSIECDRGQIELGVAIHDAGKILHPTELDQPGSEHEAAGEALMLAHGVQPHLARCCVSHATWRSPNVSFEEKSVALADKLWKGKREPDLELSVIDAAADRLGVHRWDVF